MAGAISVSTMPPMPSSPVSVDTSVRRSASSRRDSATVAEPENIYQLLGLVAERSSSGIVDKFIISQDSVGRLIQSIAPGAYESITNIDFAALDSILLKPVGIYGSESELVAFLGRFGVNVRQMRTRLPTGLYFIRGQAEPHSGAHRGYVVYWPEPNTWDDDANASVKRNRVTFMRYLTKITRQIVSLISDEHARALVWEKEDPPQAASANHLRPNQPAKLARRVYSFGVERTKEQRESVSTRPGSTINLLNGVAGTASQLGPMSPRLIPGDERQAVITGAEVPARWLGTKADVFLTPLQLKAFLRDSTRTFSLGSELTESAINTLVNAGLVQRHEALVDAYHSDLAGMEVAKQDELTFRRMEVDDALALDNPRLQDHVKNQFIGALSGMHRWAENPLRAMEIDLVAQGPPQGQHVHELDELDPSTILRINQFASVDPGQFQSLKARFSVVTDIITRNALRLNAHKFYRLDAAILTGGNTFYNVIADLNQDIATASVEASGSRGFMHKMKKSFRHMFGTGHDVVKQRVDESARVDDLVFLNEQLFQPAWGSSFPRSVAELNRLATSWLRSKIDSKTTVIAQAISAEQNAVIKEVSDSVVEMRFFEMRKPRLDVFVRDLNQAEQTRQECVHLEEIHSFAGPQPSPESPSTEVFAISKTLSEEDPAHIKYTVQPIGLTAADVQGVTADLEHIPTPIVLSSAQWELRLQPGSTLKATHVFPNGKYLVVIMDEVDSKVRFYLETETTMPSALRERKATRQIDFARVGADFIMTVDEIKRLVCLYSRLDNRLFTYAMDETFSTLRSKGGELDLFSISENPLGEIETLALIPGREEVVFVDNSGLTKIISLVTEKFKNGSIRLSEGTHSVLCSPDGNCVFLLTANASGEVVNAKACHTESFGTAPGVDLDISADMIFFPQLTSFITRNNVYLVYSSPKSSNLHSIKVLVTTKSSDFAIKAQFSAARNAASKSSLGSSLGASLSSPNKPKHNSLIDCLADVWSRYPVQATIQHARAELASERPSLHFVTSQHTNQRFTKYIRTMIEQFEHKTQKPTGTSLSDIVISTLPNMGAVLSAQFPTPSTFPVGKWLIGLLCLIPLHLAVADGNNFVPLKDGIRSTEFERSLLGLKHTEVAEELTIGWYESILSTYFADRPIRVVSSMGEQSVGKSYALNHFIDTTFAGSAMRCTEGAWMSVTPTDRELVVALDFEGIHSIERTPQEDMLLVLFNVAISDLVLFRNNFALSRDVAGMFNSFQSSAALLGDPASHPNLFRSSLEIIIKDVVETDADEIAAEFADKFRRMVYDRQGKNFITTLHRGQLDIIPWPVIQSRQFYTEMGVLKERLDSKPFTHGNALNFLRTLKLLMARLKASDWASLDPNLAEGRVSIILDQLAQALKHGFTGEDAEEGQLKNFDTKEAIETLRDTGHVFALASDESEDATSKELKFGALRANWPSPPKRQLVSEKDYLEALNKHLRTIVKIRQRRVQDWIKANIARFPADQPDILKLRLQFEALKKEMMAGVEVCGSSCEHCALLCLRPKGHGGEHNCTTDHRCIQICVLDKKVPCGFNAGHDGRHICDVKAHLCGKTCSHKGRAGCMAVCSKNVGHEDSEHMCESITHACGLPCHLSAQGHCSQPCTVDFRKKHDRHLCKDRNQCTAKCKLCERPCATRDHDHVLELGARHLCGQEHPCDKWCEGDGACDVSPTAQNQPKNGRPPRKHSQQTHSRVCAKKIPPGKLKHDGAHTHSLDAKPFHFCGEKCPGCQCVCELPYGHKQDHSTGHGTFEQTTWAKKSSPATRSPPASKSTDTSWGRGWFS